MRGVGGSEKMKLNFGDTWSLFISSDPQKSAGPFNPKVPAFGELVDVKA